MYSTIVRNDNDLRNISNSSIHSSTHYTSLKDHIHLQMDDEIRINCEYSTEGRQGFTMVTIKYQNLNSKIYFNF
jgi:hypothetical protein